MQTTVFSHIVQKRLSRENENVATEALAFILRSHEVAQNGMMKLLRGIDPKMPSRLWFQTQQAEGNSRPDMQGCDDDGKARVYFENKFWAGLTVNQPVSYLQELVKSNQPTILVVVGPKERKDLLWSGFYKRLADEKISASEGSNAGIFRITTTSIGPVLALTSWEQLITALEAEVADDKSARSDLLQLQALCSAANNDAFRPISSDELSDQRTPAFFLQLNSIREGAVEKALTTGALSLKSPFVKNPKQGQLLPQSSWKRFGRYVCFPSKSGVGACGAWLGTEFTLWKDHGSTPLWLVFADFQSGEWHVGSEVRAVLEPWASHKDIPTVWRRNDDGADEFAVGIELATGEEEEAVIASVVNQLKEIAAELSKIGPKTK